MQCFQTRFMEGICFRYVQPTIVVVKRMLCWATPLNNQPLVSSFSAAKTRKASGWVVWRAWDRELVFNTNWQKAVYPGRGPQIVGLLWLDHWHDEKERGCSISAFWFASRQKIQKVLLLYIVLYTRYIHFVWRCDLAKELRSKHNIVNRGFLANCK